MLPAPLTNLKIRKCYQSECKFNDVYSRNNLPKKRRSTCNKSVRRTHWIVSYVNGDNGSKSYDGTYFGSFRV